MEFTIFSKSQGSGYIVRNRQKLINEINPVSVSINSIIFINSGENTDLINYFDREVKYLGVKKNSTHTEMLFLLGTSNDLFSEIIYIESIYKISETRIFQIFGHGYGRDFNLINGIWK